MGQAVTGPERRVFLHVGAPKTGTTFLQRVLWTNRETLADQGVDVPGADRGEHYRAAYDLRAVPAAPADPKRPIPEWEGAWDRLAAAVRESPRAVAAISDERLAAATPEEAERAVAGLAPAELHVVYTAREFVGLLPAAWQEFVKNGFSLGFEEWLADIFDQGRDGAAGAWFWRVQDAADVLRRWAVTVPPERVHVIPMPSPPAPTALLWERFASLLDIDPGRVDMEGANVNSSLSWEQTELLRRVNAALPPDFPEWHYFGVVRDVFGRDVLQARAHRRMRPVVPPGRADEARAWAEHLVAELDRAGYDVAGELDELRPPAEPSEGDSGVESEEPGEAAATPGDGTRVPDTADVLAVSVDGIAGLLGHIGVMRDRRRRTDQRLARLQRELAAARAERDNALVRADSRGQRSANQFAKITKIRVIDKRALVDLAGRNRAVGLAYRSYRAGRRLLRRSRAAATRSPP